MDLAIASLVRSIHAAAPPYALAVTGGGTGVVASLLAVPGGSRSLLEAVVPYGEQALVDYLGHRPASFCSAATSQALARRARERSRRLTPGLPVAGVGCTASLRSDRPKRGDHRFHITVASAERECTLSLTLAKEARAREEEEAVLDRILLNALAEGFGVADRLPVPLLPGEEVERVEESASDRLAELMCRREDALCVEPDGRLRTAGPRPGLLLPGSFNPLHEGHLRLVTVAARLTGRPAAFELTVVNADKPPLGTEEVRRRLASFAWRAPVWLTAVPTFTEKARLFPGAIFVVGVDTAARIVQPRFYGDSPERLAAALDDFRQHGGRFLVAGRVDASGRFVGLDAIELPAVCRDLFAGIAEADFRADISSTQLRQQGAASGCVPLS